MEWEVERTMNALKWFYFFLSLNIAATIVNISGLTSSGFTAYDVTGLIGVTIAFTGVSVLAGAAVSLITGIDPVTTIIASTLAGTLFGVNFSSSYKIMYTFGGILGTVGTYFVTAFYCVLAIMVVVFTIQVLKSGPLQGAQ